LGFAYKQKGGEDMLELEYTNLKVQYSLLLSLYQRLRINRQISGAEAAAFSTALKLMENKIQELEEQLKVRE